MMVKSLFIHSALLRQERKSQDCLSMSLILPVVSRNWAKHHQLVQMTDLAAIMLIMDIKHSQIFDVWSSCFLKRR